MSLNKVMLIGRLGKDPELRYTAQQMPVCTFSLATGEKRKDSSGQWVEQTEWHNIVVWGKSGENCHKFLKKGREVYIEGRIQTRKWQDKEGRDRYTTEVVGLNVQFLGGGRASAEGAGGGASEGSAPSPSSADSLPSLDQAVNAPTEVAFDDDDIPF